MIYVNENSTVVKFPKVSFYEACWMKVVNQVTKKQVEWGVVDLTPWDRVYTFNLEGLVGDLEEGQYDYFIEEEGGEVISRGIMQVGDYKEEVNVYESNIEIKQYER